MRKVLETTLIKKLQHWKKKLKLGDWDIKIKYRYCGEDTAAEVEYCEPVERTAIIHIDPRYPKSEGYRVSWDVDSLIIHELIHVLLWEVIDKNLPSNVSKSKGFEEVEEFICFHFAKIIRDILKRR